MVFRENITIKQRTHLIPEWSEWPSSKNLQTKNAGEGVEKRGPSFTVGENVNTVLHSTSMENSICCAVLSRFSSVQFSAIPWFTALQAPLSMGFSRQEYWSGLPCPPPGDHPEPGVEPTSPESPGLQAKSLPLRHRGRPMKNSMEVP